MLPKELSRELHTEFTDAIKKRFNVLDIIDLYDYDHDLDKLYVKLQQLKKEQYDANERIVFVHFDTDFYLNQTLPGFLILNLHMILSSLDIPFDFTLLITNHYGINNQLSTARSMFASHELKNIPCIETNFQQSIVDDGDNIVDIDINETTINKHYSCLNGQDRAHRKFLITALDHKKLLPMGLISYHASS
jgi:hypothetical protein